MSRLAAVATAAVSLIALGACSVNTAPPVAAPAPATTVVTPPPPVTTAPGSTVVVPRAY